jgi:hypothetical protein
MRSEAFGDVTARAGLEWIVVCWPCYWETTLPFGGCKWEMGKRGEKVPRTAIFGPSYPSKPSAAGSLVSLVLCAGSHDNDRNNVYLILESGHVPSNA